MVQPQFLNDYFPFNLDSVCLSPHNDLVFYSKDEDEEEMG